MHPMSRVSKLSEAEVAERQRKASLHCYYKRREYYLDQMKAYGKRRRLEAKIRRARDLLHLYAPSEVDTLCIV